MLHIPNKSVLFGKNGDPPTINYCSIIAPQFGRTERAKIQHSSCMLCNVEQFPVLSLWALKEKYTITIGIFSLDICFFRKFLHLPSSQKLSPCIIFCTLLETWKKHFKEPGYLPNCSSILPSRIISVFLPQFVNFIIYYISIQKLTRLVNRI